MHFASNPDAPANRVEKSARTSLELRVGRSLMDAPETHIVYSLIREHRSVEEPTGSTFQLVEIGRVASIPVGCPRRIDLRWGGAVAVGGYRFDRTKDRQETSRRGDGGQDEQMKTNGPNTVMFSQRSDTSLKPLDSADRTNHSKPDPLPPYEERHYPPTYWARLWGFSAKTVREWFRGECGPGVLRQTNKGRRSKRDYVTVMISPSGAARVYAKRTGAKVVH
jgi:hypothetical protein